LAGVPGSETGASSCSRWLPTCLQKKRQKTGSHGRLWWSQDCLPRSSVRLSWFRERERERERVCIELLHYHGNSQIQKWCLPRGPIQPTIYHNSVSTFLQNRKCRYVLLYCFLIKLQTTFYRIICNILKPRWCYMVQALRRLVPAV